MGDPDTNVAEAEARETFDLPESTKQDRLQQEKLLKEMELRRKAKSTVVPTDDGKVRQLLRELGEPVTLFGEREMERRERLRRLLAERGVEVVDVPGMAHVVVEQAASEKAELRRFRTEGSAELRQARLLIARASLRAAANRIEGVKRRREDPEERHERREQKSSAVSAVKGLAQQCSEICDERPISGCAFSPDGCSVACCSWSGALSSWSVPDCQRQWSVRAHEERCTGLAWHPQAGLGQAPDAVHLATGGADCTARLFSSTGAPLMTLSGHTDRLARLAFHPLGAHLATASFDTTWRLWDVETGGCLLEQEGHSRAVYAVAFHPDGSLMASAGLDAIGRVWDLRTGRSVMVLEGHVKQILGLDFCCDGLKLATGSDDNTARVWDLRQRKCTHTLPGHRSIVASVRFEPYAGLYLLTAGYDNVAKVWSGQDFQLLRTLAGHEGKIMSADISPNMDHFIATASYDRTLKYWAPDEHVEGLDLS